MSHKVELYVYDLSQGMATIISTALIGKKVDGIWHTSIVVYGREYFFGSNGVESCNPGTTLLGEPLEKIVLGETQIPYSIFIDYLSGLSESSYRGSTYNLFRHNCNNFSQEVAQFLCAANIPKHILDLPNEVVEEKLHPALSALASQLQRYARPVEEEHQREPSPEFAQLNSQIEEARHNYQALEEKRKATKEKLARKERKKEKKRKKLLREARSLSRDFEGFNMAETEAVNGTEGQLPSEDAMQFEAEERRAEEERKRAREPPIVFKETIDVNQEFEKLSQLLDGNLNDDERRSLSELEQYMLGNEGSWIVGDGFLEFIGRLLNDKALAKEIKVHILNILSEAALKDDVILVLHQDRKDHVLMNYAFEIDRLSIEEQQAIALFIANMFENLSSSEWLLYISEWTYNNQPTSNIRVTTKVGVHSLLSDLPDLQDKGTAIVYNMACKEKMFKNFRIRQLLPRGTLSKVFDDVAVELTMALLQYFNNKPPEEQLWRCMKAMGKFTQISNQEVPQLIQMIGPDPKTFKGVSSRVDEQIDEVCKKLR